MAIILFEIGNIDCFNSPKKLVAFAGLDPKVYESANYSLKNAHISKRGSFYLRNILFLAANSTYLYSPEFKQLYLKFKTQDKHHFIILNAIAR